LFLGKGCDNTDNKDINTAVIEYVANTRGFYQKITIQKQMVTVSKDRSERKSYTSKNLRCRLENFNQNI
jgi:hypothetical protein